MHSASVLPPPASFYRRDIPLVFLCESDVKSKNLTHVVLAVSFVEFASTHKFSMSTIIYDFEIQAAY